MNTGRKLHDLINSDAKPGQYLWDAWRFSGSVPVKDRGIDDLLDISHQLITG